MPFRGRHTAATKAAISAKLKGRKRSDLTKARISAAMQGKPLSAAHRLELRVGHRRTKLFDPERYAAICAQQSEIRRRQWAAGAYDHRDCEVGPPHASTWRVIRENCDKHTADSCAYPFCRCFEQEKREIETPDRKAVA